MGMGNSAYFRVRVHKAVSETGRTTLTFEHPTLPGAQKGGWMGDEAGGWKPDYAAPGVVAAPPAAAAGAAAAALVAPAAAAAKGAASAKVAPGEGGRKITMAEVEQHHTELDCWIVVGGKVYDTTKFNATHPGGGSSIFINAGTDTTEEFEAIHSKRARAQPSLSPPAALSATLPARLPPEPSHAPCVGAGAALLRNRRSSAAAPAFCEFLLARPKPHGILWLGSLPVDTRSRRGTC